MSLEPSKPNEIRYDPNHAVSNIFRVLPDTLKRMPTAKRQSPRLQMWESDARENGVGIKYTGLFLLDTFDLHVLLALVAIAIQNPIVVKAETASKEGKTLRKTLATKSANTLVEDEGSSHQLLLDLLDDESHAALPIAAVAKFTRYQLTSLVTGGDSKEKYQRVKESLFRLMHTTLAVTDTDGSRYTSNMVSAIHESAGGNVAVAVNPVLTRSLRLDTHFRYIKLYLDAFATLSPAGKLLYTYLSGRTWDAKPHEYTTATLVELVYPPSPLDTAKPPSRKAMEHRVKTVQAAMQALGQLENWTVTEKTSARGLQKWSVARKKPA
jgi:hypothetical protein